MEIFNAWCGPSNAICATLKRLYFDLGDKGLKCYTVEAGLLQCTKAHQGKCEPAFMFFWNGQELPDLKIVGIDAFKLTQSITSKLTDVSAAA
jgi:hypothetical protein